MVIDTSAIVAILAAEPEAEHFAELIEAAPRPLVSAASMVEAGIVLGPEHAATLDAFVAAAGLEVVPVDEAQSRAAREAHRRFGRGSPSRARLTFGDCFSYALARTNDLPLLFKGDDFARTDLAPASAPPHR